MLSDKMEIWKDIREYEGLYQISNLGRVKSVNRKVECGVITIKEKIRKLNPNGNGYLNLLLHAEGSVQIKVGLEELGVVLT